MLQKESWARLAILLLGVRQDLGVLLEQGVLQVPGVRQGLPDCGQGLGLDLDLDLGSGVDWGLDLGLILVLGV